MPFAGRGRTAGNAKRWLGFAGFRLEVEQQPGEVVRRGLFSPLEMEEFKVEAMFGLKDSCR